MLSDGNCFIEMGAGRGHVNHWIQRALGNETQAQFVLVDRQGVRYKMDSQHRDDHEGNCGAHSKHCPENTTIQAQCPRFTAHSLPLNTPQSPYTEPQIHRSSGKKNHIATQHPSIILLRCPDPPPIGNNFISPLIHLNHVQR